MQIVHDNPESRAQEVAGHGRAHVAEADEADGLRKRSVLGRWGHDSAPSKSGRAARDWFKENRRSMKRPPVRGPKTGLVGELDAELVFAIEQAAGAHQFADTITE